MNSRPARGGALGLVIATTLAATACSDDDGGAASTSAPAPASTAAATTATSAEPSTRAPAEGPTGPGCSRFPASGEGSLAALAEAPAGTAISHVPELSAMVAAIDAAGLLDALNGRGPLTIFAPVNSAFDAIPQADLDAMLTDRAALNSILTYHAIAEELSSADLAADREERTIEGQALSLAATRDGLEINAGQANVICADIPTANATIHLIDGVLMPPPSETDVVAGTALYSVDLGTGAATQIGPIGDELGVIGMAIAPGVGASTVYGLTDVPELITFDAADPGTVSSSVPITGVAQGSSLLAIDVRPSDGQIYALSDASALYTIDPATGAATSVGTGTNPPVEDPGFGFDVDPVTDRIRVDVATGQNLSIDPATSDTTANRSLAYAPRDPNTAAAPRVVAAAVAPDGQPFVVDAATGTLALQVPLNRGTLVTVGPLGVDVTDGASFDIAPSGDALLASPG